MLYTDRDNPMSGAVEVMLPIELVYAAFLLSSVVSSVLIRRLPSPELRRAVGLLVGTGTIILLDGAATLIIFIGASCILLFVLPPGSVRISFFVYSFAFLVPARLYGGIDGLSNACLLILALRNCIYAADAGHDAESSLRSIYDYLSYVLSCPAIITGPVYTVKDYREAIGSCDRDVNISEMFRRGVFATYWAVAFIISITCFPLDYMLTDDFAGHWLPVQFGYLILSVYHFRARCFAAWYIAEAGLAAVGIKARNTDFGAPERARTVGEYVRCWNMSVQSFFAVYVYRPLRSTIPSRRLRAALVMCLSAYWHGLQPGLYVFFLSIFFETASVDTVPSSLPLPLANIHVSLVGSYYVLPFLFKNDISNAYKVWASMGHAGHWYTAVRAVLCMAMSPSSSDAKHIKRCP
ncbi:Lysophospholipid acyltransferase 7 [Perkinsus olseni]|uniref:Lysophospholipid acyltransferase 7 n=1 Tax=Perkinsus olseni TaxID=32597 RepID=A0A7J6L2F9_PEROL|nr:Lysophospholipid acyltransferase 7 [Perkinsus olseni]